MKTHVWVEDPRDVDDSRELAIRIEPPGKEPKRIWFRVPSVFAPELTDRADFAAIIAQFSVMKEPYPTVIHGEVSPRLLENLEGFQAAWTSWFPQQYKMTPLTADQERERDSGDGDTIVAFSGGVDAAFTTYRNQKGLTGRRAHPIRSAVMIQGYDFPASDNARFNAAFGAARKMTDSLGINLIPVCTNYREVERVWEDVHMTCVVACLQLFEGHYTNAVVGSTEPYSSLVFPWASNPVTDHLLSSKHFRIIHDGAEANRIQKLQLLLQWPEACENLMVCWEPTAAGRNCCKCVKCIRTILNFRVLGVERPPFFDTDIIDSQILQMRNLNDTMINDFDIIVVGAKAAGMKESWVTAVDSVIKKYRTRKALNKNPLVSHLKEKMKRNALGKAVLRKVRQ